jgi:hypothetical protein
VSELLTQRGVFAGKACHEGVQLGVLGLIGPASALQLIHLPFLALP